MPDTQELYTGGYANGETYSIALWLRGERDRFAQVEALVDNLSFQPGTAACQTEPVNQLADELKDLAINSPLLEDLEGTPFYHMINKALNDIVDWRAIAEEFIRQLIDDPAASDRAIAAQA